MRISLIKFSSVTANQNLIRDLDGYPYKLIGIKSIVSVNQGGFEIQIVAIVDVRPLQGRKDRGSLFVPMYDPSRVGKVRARMVRFRCATV